MNKKRVIAVSITLSILSLLILHFVSYLHSNTIIDVIYFPALILSLLLSGENHYPTEVTIFFGFLAYSLFVLMIFTIFYALTLQFYIIFRSKKDIESASSELTAESPDIENAAKLLQHAISEYEIRRKSHYLLAPSSTEKSLLKNRQIFIKSKSPAIIHPIISELHKNLVNKGLPESKINKIIGDTLAKLDFI